MKTILMVKVGTATFVERDERLLREQFRLKVFRFGTKGLSFVASIGGYVLWILRHIWMADILFTRFAHYHAFLLGLTGFLFGKSVVIVVGGSDAIWIPRLHYGVYDHWLSRHTTRWALQLATRIVPNHESLVRGVNTYSDVSPRDEGLLCYNPTLRTPIEVVHNGYDGEFWTPRPGVERRQCILTVAPATDPVVFFTKGLDMLLHSAERLQDVPFTLVGVAAVDAARWTGRPVPNNVECRPVLSPAELKDLYSTSAVLAHYTLTEGMPNVLCEAMLCECVPVGSAVNSIPDIIGDAGFLVERPDVMLWVDTLQKALTSSLGQKARKRILERYPLSKRKSELIRILNTLES